jgi:hypothetical protein
MAPSIYIVLETAIGLSQQLRRHRQITLSRVQVDMSEIGGKSRQESLHIRTVSVPLRQPVDGERVPQVMEPRLVRTRLAPANSRKTAQATEGEVQHAVAERLMLPRLEKRLVMLIPSSRR